MSPIEISLELPNSFCWFLVLDGALTKRALKVVYLEAANSRVLGIIASIKKEGNWGRNPSYAHEMLWHSANSDEMEYYRVQVAKISTHRGVATPEGQCIYDVPCYTGLTYVSGQKGSLSENAKLMWIYLWSQNGPTVGP